MPHEINPETIGIVFDCDSTLSTIEGIDELATLAGKGAEVKALTDAAMNGEIALEAVYEKRLELIRPNQALLAQVADLYLKTQTKNAAQLVQLLKEQGFQVAMVSGGLFEAVEPLAKALLIDDVFAVPLEFDDHGNYLRTPPHPLTTAHGKNEIIAAWRMSKALSRVVMIGDGMSDVAAKPAADYVIGFGGVVVREKVKAAADSFVAEGDMLALVSAIEAALGV